MQDVIRSNSSVQMERVSKTRICVMDGMTVKTWLMSRTVNLQVYCTLAATLATFSLHLPSEWSELARYHVMLFSFRPSVRPSFREHSVFRCKYLEIGLR